MMKNHRFWQVILVWGRSKVIFDPKMSHFTTVPKSLYPPKVTLEHLVDDCGTTRNQRRDDPKVTLLHNPRSFVGDTPTKKYEV